MKLVKSASDLPKNPHFAIIIYKSDSVYIPGDRRSEECPGHGYPAETRHYSTCEHWVTEDRKIWEDRIRIHHNLRSVFTFFEVSKVGSLDIQVVIK